MKFLLVTIITFTASLSFAAINWAKVKASDKVERTKIANTGVTIEAIVDDTVYVLASDEQLSKLKTFAKVESFHIMKPSDFPRRDARFHNYNELVTEMKNLETNFGDILSLEVIGKSLEGREIYNMTITGPTNNRGDMPGIVFMGGHHAREHISVEMPLMLAQHLVKEYKNGNQQIIDLVNTREIHIIPVVNPDGKEHDIASGNYKMWRKNRRSNNDGSYGVDLNRNYSFQWGTGGASANPRHDTYRGPQPFSEPETQAIRDFVTGLDNLSILLSFHTFSELILYPWGHKYDSIGNSIDFETHKRMAQEMAKWNNYTPQQSSDLYIASGDTTDWSYGQEGLISFTFELDPKSMWDGGFYPGANRIDVVFQKNIQPCLYLIGYADNPRRVVQPAHKALGLNSPLVH